MNAGDVVDFGNTKILGKLLKEVTNLNTVKIGLNLKRLIELHLLQEKIH